MNGQNPMGPGPGPDMRQMNMNVRVEDLEAVKCKRCRGELFQQAVGIRRLSPLVSPDGKEKFISVPVLVCMNCKELLLPSQVGEAKAADEKVPGSKTP